MGYFNINIDNDITYLLQEIGHNIKVNNVPASAIINNASLERTWDDKKLITFEELRRGQYINYNDLFFIVLNEVNDKRYLSYNKGIIRRCNFDIKFIISDYLYQFPSIIEGEKFFISDNGLMSLNADTITVTLPLTEITKQLKKLDEFIKWGQSWSIQGIDYTKDGLAILNCTVSSLGGNDDVANEIADRWKDAQGGGKIDRLNGNIIPLMPFEEPQEPTPNIITVATFGDVPVEFGTLIDDIELPSVVVATLDNDTTVELNITWDTSNYDGEVTANYNIIGTIELVEGITNLNNVVAKIRIIVGDAPIEEPDIEPTYEIIGQPEYVGDPDNEIWYGSWTIYTIKKFIDGVETTGNFTFELSDSSKATLSEVTNNSCKVSVNSTGVAGRHSTILIVTDTGKIAVEKSITIIGR